MPDRQARHGVFSFRRLASNRLPLVLGILRQQFGLSRWALGVGRWA
ncbi:hypothetical protein SAMN05216551_11024, partial [Chitinasiproducens palmae]